MKVKFRVIKRSTAPEHRGCKKFRWLGQRFSCAGHALAALINVIGQLKCDWDRIDIQLIQGKEEGGGKAREGLSR